MTSLVDTDLERNMKRVQPFVGLLLVLSVALMVFMVIRKSAENLVHALSPTSESEVTGTIQLAAPAPTYGGLVSFRTSTAGEERADAQQYISVLCFQDDTLVYQYTDRAHSKFLLTDQRDPGFDWNGDAAWCSARLLYRVPTVAGAELYTLDTTSFDVPQVRIEGN